MQNDEKERAAIIATVDAMFEALKTRDTEAWKRLMHPGGAWFVQTIDGNGESDLTVDTTPARIEALATMDAGIDDAYASPRIDIDESIATFWAPYRATLDGELIGCGTDAFQLVKVDGEWLIANIMFTQRADDCPPLD